MTPNAHRMAREWVLLDNLFVNGEVSEMGINGAMGHTRQHLRPKHGYKVIVAGQSPKRAKANWAPTKGCVRRQPDTCGTIAHDMD